MRKLSKWTRLVPVGAFALVMGACADQSPTEVQLEPGSPSQAVAATVTVYPAKYTLDIGQVKQLVALPRSATGATLSTAKTPIVWSSSNAKIASVSATGRVTAHSGGTAYITAKYGTVSQRATIVVRAPTKAASIAVLASATNVKVGKYAQLTATAKDASGKPVSVPLTWKSSNAKVIQVYANGLVKAVGAGSATVTVSGGGATGKVSLTAGSLSSKAPSTSDGASKGTNVASVAVFPMTQSLKVGLAKQFIALPRDKSGSTLGGKSPVWKSSNPSVATISSSGLVRTVGVGTATITATVDGVVGKAALTVTK